MTAFEAQDDSKAAGAHSLAERALAELAGSFLICFAIYVVCSLGSSIYGLNMAFIAAGVALAYGAVTWMLGSVSGGQFNPAVTVAAMLASKTRAVDGVAYIVAQLVGAIGAGALLRFLLPTSDSIAMKVWLTPAVNGFGEGSVAYSTVNSVGISFGITLAIVVGTAMRSTDESGRPGASYAPAMGAAYGVGAAITYPVTGAALNPARATGIAVFAQGQGLTTEPLQQLWVFWVCPVLAAAVVALVMIVAQMAKDAAAKKRAAAAAAEAPESADADVFADQDFADQASAEQADAEVDGEQPDAQRDADEGVERH